MKKVSVMLLVLISCVLLIGCAKTPKCADENVKKEVLNITNREAAIALVTIVTANNYKIKDEADLKEFFEGNDLKNMTIEEKNYYKDKRERLRVKTAEALKTLDIQLNYIRDIGSSDNQKKCNCAAIIQSSENRKIDITYVAQYTEDGKLFVEVKGLHGF